MDEGENMLETLTREMLEETGYACTEAAEMGYIECNSATLDKAELSYWYAVSVVGGKDAPRMTDEEIGEDTCLQWYAPREAYELIKHSHADTYGIKFMITRDVAILQRFNEGIPT